MKTLYIGPFSPEEIDTIKHAMRAQLDNLEQFLDHGIEPTVDSAIPFIQEQNRIGRIIDRIEHIQLSR